MQYKSKDEFPKDKATGKTILGSAEAMREWVELGFEEQKKQHIDGIPFYPYIDLIDCILYVSYPIGKSETTSRIFNLCDVAGTIPGTKKMENDPHGFLFQVDLPILFRGSILKGAFFHYVCFKDRVDLSNATIEHSSCFKCKFEKGLFAQGAVFKDTFSWDQCEFEDSVYLSSTDFEVLTFSIRECIFKDDLNMSSLKINTPSIKNHPIDLYKTEIRSFVLKNLTRIDRDFCISDCKVGDLIISNPKFDYSFCLTSTDLSGIGLIHCTDSCTSSETKMKDLIIDRCNFIKQMHIEQTNIPNLTVRFCSILDNALFRISSCKIQKFEEVECIVSGCVELKDNVLQNLLLDLVLFGHVIFQDNKVQSYNSRDTVRILKHEAIECNDMVTAVELDKLEKEILRKGKEWGNVPLRDKAILWLDQFSNSFGNNWVRPLLWMLFIVLLLTSMIFACSIYNQFDFSTNGFEMFFHGFLSNLNIFSIADFDNITESYHLNPLGQALWLFNKVIVTYLAYQCIVAFRKFNRNF